MKGWTSYTRTVRVFLTVGDHLRAVAAGDSREGRLEPSPMDLPDEMEVDGPLRIGGRQSLQPAQDILAAALDLLSGR